MRLIFHWLCLCHCYFVVDIRAVWVCCSSSFTRTVWGKARFLKSHYFSEIQTAAITCWGAILKHANIFRRFVFSVMLLSSVAELDDLCSRRNQECTIWVHSAGFCACCTFRNCVQSMFLFECLTQISVMFIRCSNFPGSTQIASDDRQINRVKWIDERKMHTNVPNHHQLTVLRSMYVHLQSPRFRRNMSLLRLLRARKIQTTYVNPNESNKWTQSRWQRVSDYTKWILCDMCVSIWVNAVEILSNYIIFQIYRSFWKHSNCFSRVCAGCNHQRRGTWTKSATVYRRMLVRVSINLQYLLLLHCCNRYRPVLILFCFRLSYFELKAPWVILWGGKTFWISYVYSIRLPSGLFYIVVTNTLQQCSRFANTFSHKCVMHIRGGVIKLQFITQTGLSEPNL